MFALIWVKFSRVEFEGSASFRQVVFRIVKLSTGDKKGLHKGRRSLSIFSCPCSLIIYSRAAPPYMSKNRQKLGQEKSKALVFSIF